METVQVVAQGAIVHYGPAILSWMERMTTTSTDTRLLHLSSLPRTRKIERFMLGVVLELNRGECGKDGPRG